MPRESRERILEWARRKGPNTPYRGKTPLLRALELKDPDLFAELLEMGARPGKEHAEAIPFFQVERGKLPRVVGALAARLAEEVLEDPGFSYDPRLLGRLLSWVKDGEDLFPLLKPLALALSTAAREAGRKEALGWLYALLHLAAAVSHEAVEGLAEWGVPLGEVPGAVHAVFGPEVPRERRASVLRLLLKLSASPEGREDAPPPLALAAASGEVELVELLLAHGADPFRKDREGRYATAYCESPEVLKALMDRGVPVDLTKRSVRALSRLDPALAARTLREKAPGTGDWAAVSLGEAAFLEAVVRAEVPGEELQARLSLFEGVRLPRVLSLWEFRGGLGKLLALARWARERGLKLGEGWMALALRLGADEEALRDLMQGVEEEELLQEALEAYRLLSPFAPGRDRERLGVFAWLSREVGAAYLPVGDTGQLSAYLEAGGNPDARVDRWGRTLLHDAVACKSVEALALLLEKGARPDPKDGKGQTPLHYLLLSPWGGYRAPDETTEVLLALLLAHGASLEERDGEGKTLRDHALEAVRRFKRSKYTQGEAQRTADFLQRVLRGEGAAKGKALEVLSGL